VKRRQVKRLVAKLKRGRPAITWRECDWLVKTFWSRIAEKAGEWVDRMVDHETRGTSPHRAAGIFGTGEENPT